MPISTEQTDWIVYPHDLPVPQLSEVCVCAADVVNANLTALDPDSMGRAKRTVEAVMYRAVIANAFRKIYSAGTDETAARLGFKSGAEFVGCNGFAPRFMRSPAAMKINNEIIRRLGERYTGKQDNAS